MMNMNNTNQTPVTASGKAPRRYKGHINSARARVRNIIKLMGYPIGRIEGRYHPYGPEQTVIEGFRVSRVGCSRTLHVYYQISTARMGIESDASKQQRKNLEHLVWDELRKAGLPFDEKGYMDCEYYR